MTSNGTPHHNAIPSEVGWQFVPQYYNFVNKEPERLHCFYNKRSTFIHGSEGEDGKTCHGQQEIHAQITSLGFQDCKIFIHSVDAQSSADGGIIIQVIGEMSNSSGPWRKFVQTFFLAEQPNGYFVLNDIFRFLKEDTVEGDQADEPESAVESTSLPEAPTPPVEFTREPTPPAPPVEAVDATAAPVEEPPTTVADIDEPAPPAPEPEPTAHVNGVEIEKPATPTPSKSPAPPPPAPPASAPTPPPAATPSVAPAAAPSPAPAPPAAAAPATAPAPSAPAAPAAPKTWAHLAATNSKKWGSAVAQESRGSSENVPSAPAAASTSGSPTPVKAPATPTRTPHPLYAAAQSVTTSHCFIKSVTEHITPQALTAALNRFGALKSVEIVRNKACAFAEFNTVEAAKRAIILSLPPAAGGEGGVKVDVPGGESFRIIVETKRERGDRPVSNRGRGGPPFTGEGRGGGPGSDSRGGFRGAPRGGGGRGRGAK